MSDLYKEKPNRYVASLFDDVNKVVIDKTEKLYYPHEISIVEQSEHKAKVSKNYFKGSYWLVEVLYNNETLFVANNTQLEKGSEVYIKFNE